MSMQSCWRHSHLHHASFCSTLLQLRHRRCLSASTSYYNPLQWLRSAFGSGLPLCPSLSSPPPTAGAEKDDAETGGFNSGSGEAAFADEPISNPRKSRSSASASTVSTPEASTSADSASTSSTSSTSEAEADVDPTSENERQAPVSLESASRISLLESYGSFPNVYIEAESRLGELASDSLRVSVRASSINALDSRMRHGYGRSLFEIMRDTRFPFTLGLDCSGIVQEVGRNVPNFCVGDEVIAVKSPLLHDGAGCHSDVVDIPSVSAVQKPTNVSFESAAAAGFAGMTALSALESSSRVSSSSSHGIQRALVIGGSGGVGSMVVQFLKQDGVEVWTTCSRHNMHFCRSKLGADYVLEHSVLRGDKQQQQLDANEPVPVSPCSLDLIIDAGPPPPADIGSDPTSLVDWLLPLLNCIRAGGSYVTLSPPLLSDCDAAGAAWALGGVQSLLRGAMLKASVYMRTQTHYEWAFFRPSKTNLQFIADSLESKKLIAPIAAQFSLQQIHKAFECFETQQVAGKVVLRMGEGLDPDLHANEATQTPSS